jgi:hypothetical protein
VWAAVGNDFDKMHLAIFELAKRLPNLRQLDHSGFDTNRQAYKRIMLQSEVVEQDGEEMEYVSYKVVKPNPRYVLFPQVEAPHPQSFQCLRDTWDIFDGGFD